MPPWCHYAHSLCMSSSLQCPQYKRADIDLQPWHIMRALQKLIQCTHTMCYPSPHWWSSAGSYRTKAQSQVRKSHSWRFLHPKFRCNIKDLGSICHVNYSQSSELSLHMSTFNKTKFIHNIQKKNQLQNHPFWLPFLFPPSARVTSSHSRQIMRLRTTTSKWHFDIRASRIREQRTNLVNILGTIHITS